MADFSDYQESRSQRALHVIVETAMLPFGLLLLLFIMGLSSVSLGIQPADDSAFHT